MKKISIKGVKPLQLMKRRKHNRICKEKDFIIEEEGNHAFMQLKQALVEAPILQSPN